MGAADARNHMRAVSLLQEGISLVEKRPVDVRSAFTAQVEDLQKLVQRLERREFTSQARKHMLQKADNVLTGKSGYDKWL